jgi:type IX secretion system PorP/SprF family membrane protein
MKRRLRLIVFGICSLILVMSSQAQDLHFSQFMNSPLLTNPANTGFVPDGDYRLGVNYRNQWSSLMTIPYKTMSAFGDVQMMQSENGWLGVGGLLLRDVAGSGNLTSTRVYGSIAYHQMLNLGSLLSMGFNVGYANKRINTANLTFPSQWNGKFFDVHDLGHAPALATNNISYLDIQAGLNYAYFPNDYVYVNAGFSSHHLNRPRESFFDDQSNIDNRIPVRHTAFINGIFKLNDQWLVNPNAYFSLQAKSSEFVIGANAHYNLSGDGQTILIGGLYYRGNDAAIPMIGIGLKEYTFTFTYDATISSLKNYNNGQGALEFSLIKTGAFGTPGPKNMKCPSLKY